MSFCKVLKEQSEKLESEMNIPEGKLEAHKKLRVTCDSLQTEYKNGGDVDSGIDQIAVIKKAFYEPREEADFNGLISIRFHPLNLSD